MRLFTAITLPEPAWRHLADVQRGLPTRALRLVGSQNLHITLKFLGEVETSGVAGVVAALSGVQIPAMRLKTGPMIDLSGRGRLNVVAASVDGGTLKLRSLFGDIEAALATLGFVAESRKFHAHVTLARVAPRGRIHRGDLPDWTAGPEFACGGFELMSSTLAPGGAVHEIVARFTRD
ncbi:MAG: RNA 2',3'-cyclic phosphodiesterase [Tepidisphaeraceae bacterium]